MTLYGYGDLLTHRLTYQMLVIIFVSHSLFSPNLSLQLQWHKRALARFFRGAQIFSGCPFDYSSTKF